MEYNITLYLAKIYNMRLVKFCKKSGVDNNMYSILLENNKCRMETEILLFVLIQYFVMRDFISVTGKRFHKI